MAEATAQTDAVWCTCHVHDKPDNQYETPLFLSAILADQLCMPNRLLPLTARLGLPLYYCVCDLPFSYRVAVSQLNGLREVTNNPVLEDFSVRKGAGGELQNEGLEGISRPTILLARADGNALKVSHVFAMWVFIDDTHIRARKAFPNASLSVINDKFFSELTAENFVKFWERMHKNEECPVHLGCKACGKVEDVSLSHCGKCGVLKYCGRDCQKSDWAAHKKVCKLYFETLAA